jgi:cytochrome b561
MKEEGESSGNLFYEVAEMTNNMHRFAPLLYYIYLLLHVSAVFCHHQGASGSVRAT